MYRIKLLFGKSSASEDKVKSENKMEKKVDLITRILGPMESYVIELQSLLIWENPSKSISAFITCNLFFWLAVYCQYRFYFLIASITAITYIWRTWTRQIWPEIRVPVPEGEDTEEWTPVNPQVYSVPEISRYLSQAIEDYKALTNFLINFRRDHHGKFCAAASSILLMLWYISRCVSGVFISYLIMCLISLGPGFIVHIYPRLRGALTKSGIFASLESSTIKVQEIDDPVEEYFPEPCEEVLKDLETALETNALFNEQEDSNDTLMGTISKDSDDFAPSLNLMPSYDNDSDSGTEGEEAAAILNVAATEGSKISEKKHVPAQFVDFDSDEDEEDKFARGLRFESEERMTSPRLPLSSSSSSSSSTCSDQVDRCEEVPQVGEPDQIEKPPSRRPSQSDLELSDYEMISESELS